MRAQNRGVRGERLLRCMLCACAAAMHARDLEHCAPAAAAALLCAARCFAARSLQHTVTPTAARREGCTVAAQRALEAMRACTANTSQTLAPACDAAEQNALSAVQLQGAAQRGVRQRQTFLTHPSNLIVDTYWHEVGMQGLCGLRRRLRRGVLSRVAGRRPIPICTVASAAQVFSVDIDVDRQELWLNFVMQIVCMRQIPR